LSLLIDQLLRAYDVTRLKNDNIRQLRLEEAYAKIPELSALSDQINQKRRELTRSADIASAAEKLDSEIDSMVAQKRQLLIKNGYPENYLDSIFDCLLCEDTGYDRTTRKYCACFNQALQNEKYRELSVSVENITFERFDFSLFPNDAEVFENVTQQQNMKRIYDACVKFAESFPQTQKPNMVFSGASGLGKTYLLKCIANRIIQRGHSCLYITSCNLFDILKKEYLGEAATSEDFYKTPLLIIDDLGTEPLMNNITSESLFNLLNERKNAKLHTLFATNFSPAGIKERYGERIFSRLLSVEDADFFSFKGRDLRFIEKKQ
jgi:DNA replication protein DnaC